MSNIPRYPLSILFNVRRYFHTQERVVSMLDLVKDRLEL
jgi:hypothetical protein